MMKIRRGLLASAGILALTAVSAWAQQVVWCAASMSMRTAKEKTGAPHLERGASR